MEIQNNTVRAFRILALLALISGTTFAASWSEANVGLPGAALGVDALTVDPGSPSTIYARTSIGVFKSTDGAGSWRRLSSIVGVSSLVVDPTDSSILYAGTRHGIVKSTNGGESWIGANSGVTGTVFKLVIDPITPSTLYAVTYPSGVFKSTDGGGSWNAANAGLPRNPPILVIDPVTPSTIYAFADVGIFKSMDGGEKWSAMDIGLPVNSPAIALAIAPTAPATMYVVYVDRVARGTAVTKSTDGGRSWNAVDIGLPPRASISLTIDPVTPSTVYIIYTAFNAGGGIVKSTDGGASWNPMDEGLPAGDFTRTIAIDPKLPSTIYTAYMDYRTGGGGVFKSTRGGTSWSRADAGLADIDIRTLAIDPSNAAIVYAGGRDGLFKSVDRGASWTNLIAFQLPAPSWPPPLTQPPPFGAGPAHMRSLLIDFTNPNVLYARTIRYSACAFSDKLVFKSVDGGATWSDGASPPSSGCRLSDLMVMDPTDPDTIYIAEAEDSSWMLKSIDGGANWTTIWDWAHGMESGLNALVIDPTNPTKLYAGIGDVATITPGSPVSGLMKSTDGGASWTTSGLQGSAVTLLAMNPSDPSILYAATEGFTSEPKGFRGLYKSTDYGASWFAVNKGLDSLIDTRSRISALVIDRDNPSLLYAGTSGAGVFRSSDGGANWSPLNEGLANLDIRVLAMAPGAPKILYAGTSSGVFKTIDDVGREGAGSFLVAPANR